MSTTLTDVILGRPLYRARDRPLAARFRQTRWARLQAHRAPLLFGRLWEETGCRAVIEALLTARSFEFPVERAVFAGVLHRIFLALVLRKELGGSPS